MIVGNTGPEIITQTPGWPLWHITIADHTIPRPAILQR